MQKYVAPKTDYDKNNKAPDGSDMNRIEGNIKAIKEIAESTVVLSGTVFRTPTMHGWYKFIFIQVKPQTKLILDRLVYAGFGESNFTDKIRLLNYENILGVYYDSSVESDLAPFANQNLKKTIVENDTMQDVNLFLAVEVDFGASDTPWGPDMPHRYFQFYLTREAI